uniref:Uncharacterized protein n=1 Tax=Helicotheca tamesis TaxID=374047 RepID=A0A7S2IGY2_9STRA
MARYIRKGGDTYRELTTFRSFSPPQEPSAPAPNRRRTPSDTTQDWMRTLCRPYGRSYTVPSRLSLKIFSTPSTKRSTKIHQLDPTCPKKLFARNKDPRGWHSHCSGGRALFLQDTL